jgi:cell pole-organizing protein PopZ
MGDIRNEPSMEEILASIKRIIAEDSVVAPSATRARRGPGPVAVPLETQEAAVPQPAAKPIVDANDDEEVLELTQSMDPAPTPQPEELAIEEQPAVQQEAVTQEPVANARLVSESALSASRNALASLSAMIVKPESNGDNTLDGLVREMLRPMLKEWLDSRLPELVEKMVEKEIARITGRAF